MAITDSQNRPSLLADLETRQDEVIAQLDELNERIERLLCEHLGGATAGGEGVGVSDPDSVGPATGEHHPGL